MTMGAIPQKFHRSVMGPKGSKIQQITRDYNVQIKFPDREENPGGSWAGVVGPLPTSVSRDSGVALVCRSRLCPGCREMKGPSDVLRVPSG